MKTWGLTGGIASGKSTVLKELFKLGAQVVDADEVAREVVNPFTQVGKETLAKIAAAFGRSVIGPDLSLDRAKLRDLIAQNPASQAQLEAIMHPVILLEIKKMVDGARKHGAQCVVIEGTRLIESGFADQLDGLLFVEAPDEARIARAMSRDKVSRESVEKIAKIQNTDLMKQKAHFTIVNDGDEAHLKAQVEQFFREKILS